MKPRRPSRDVLLAVAVALAAPLAATVLSCRGAAPPGRPGATPAATATPAPGAGFSKPYRFTTDWLSPQVATWSRVLAPLRGKPDVRYLEVGMYEGRSLLWAAENVFTHPTSRLVGVDIELRPQLVANVRMSGQANRITTILGSSRTELRKLDVSSFDVLYVDGSHESADVLSDAVQGYALVKDGGLMIFDDYGWVGPWVGRRGQLLPDTLRPKASIDAFIAAYRYGLAVVESGYQMILRKRVDPCRQAGLEGPCSPFGQYAFDWMSERLVRPGPPAALVPISPAETELVESFLRSEGRVEGGDKAFAALVWRLELDLSDGR